MHQFSIITPTFNRAKYLPDVYAFLQKQDGIDFEWIIVDDGSKDDTKNVVSSFVPFPAPCTLRYIYQENTGKPGAVNTGVKMADSYISILFDDDDILLPDALKTVWYYFDAAAGKFENNCVGIIGLCQYDNGQIIGRKFPWDYFISDNINCTFNMNYRQDTTDFYLTNIIKKYPYPIFENEKNITPSIVWIRIAIDYQTIYINKTLSQKQYLQDGLSNQNYGLKYTHGSELYYNECTHPKFRFELRVRNSEDYIRFAKINKQKHIFKNALNKKIFPLGLCLYHLRRNIFIKKIYKIIKNCFKVDKPDENKKIFKEG
jgi:glycosyltransferase involved in cell wall biosynthesis